MGSKFKHTTIICFVAMDFCRNVSVSGEYQQEQVLSPPCSKLGDLSTSLDDLFSAQNTVSLSFSLSLSEQSPSGAALQISFVCFYFLNVLLLGYFFCLFILAYFHLIGFPFFCSFLCFSASMCVTSPLNIFIPMSHLTNI